MPRVSSPEFDRALVVPKDMFGIYPFPVRVDSDIRALFGDDWVLSVEDIIHRWADLMRSTYPVSVLGNVPEGCIVVQHCEGAGTLVHYALRHELITQEADPDGEPRWRLARREPTFVYHTVTQNSVRVRGLPPEQQAAQYAREQRQARLTATLDRNARNRADEDIRHLVSVMVRDGAMRVVGQLYHVKRRLPEIAHGRTVGEISTMISDAHHRLEMSRPELRAWIKELSEDARRLHNWVDAPPLPVNTGLVRIARGGGLGIVSEFDLAPLPPIKPLLPPREDSAPLPAEDEAALKDLAL